MLELIVTKQFRRDLIRAHDVISNQQPYVNPNAARRLFKHVDTTIDQIRDFPYVSQVAYSDTVSLIALSEIDWHDKPSEYFANWRRLSVGHIPSKCRNAMDKVINPSD